MIENAALYPLKETGKALAYYDLYVKLARIDEIDLQEDALLLQDDLKPVMEALHQFENIFHSWALADPAEEETKALKAYDLRTTGSILLPLIKTCLNAIHLRIEILTKCFPEG